MTASEWDRCTDPQAMLAVLQATGMLSERKARLFAASCCRRLWSLLTDDKSRRAVETPARTAGAAPPAVRTYRVHLTVPHPTQGPASDLVVPLLAVAETSLPPLGHDVPIGCDVLTLCRFVYDGRARTFRLDY